MRSSSLITLAKTASFLGLKIPEKKEAVMDLRSACNASEGCQQEATHDKEIFRSDRDSLLNDDTSQPLSI